MKSVRLIHRFCKLSAVNLSACCHKSPTKLHVRYSTSVVCTNHTRFVPMVIKVRNLGLGPTSKDFEEPAQLSGPLTKAHATELVFRLNNDERKMLFNALQEYESNRLKEDFEGKS